jgi:hypothetical protein
MWCIALFVQYAKLVLVFRPWLTTSVRRELWQSSRQSMTFCATPIVESSSGPPAGFPTAENIFRNRWFSSNIACRFFDTPDWHNPCDIQAVYRVFGSI